MTRDELREQYNSLGLLAMGTGVQPLVFLRIDNSVEVVGFADRRMLKAVVNAAVDLSIDNGESFKKGEAATPKPEGKTT